MSISDPFQLLSLISLGVTLFTSMVIILDDTKSSETTIAWLLVIFLFKWIGVLFYVLLGINWKKRKIVQQKPEDIFGSFLQPVLQRQQDFISRLIETHESESYSDMTKLMRMLLSGNNSIITLNNRIRFFHNGKDAFASMFHDLKRARETIHMEFYIWRSDELGEELKEILIERARNGVDVKLIFDGLGSFGKISYAYRRELKEAGIRFSYFLDLNLAPARLKINYRNHRKVVVIDGRKAYTGGINVGKEYIDGGSKFEQWRDTALRITGDSVMMLQALFLIDWASSGNEQVLDGKLFPAFHPGERQTPVQIAFSGPDSRWSSIEQLFFLMITNANTDIWIQSPYFIPSQGILHALQSAALSGVNVHLMMTGIPDKHPPFWAAHTYFPGLVDAGVKLYLYRRGFLHSKTVVADSKICSVGSCNMDMRSFHINFEANAVIYDEDLSRQLVDQFRRDLAFCEEVTHASLTSQSPFIKLRNSILRIFSPIM
ncbi:cardiolipin synthase [Salinispira pacifica]|uniref:Cardiolipin synthase n=1 Tax=Salinispira pacifica TaxID=1307761 RepID=V5WHL8_9SPIO|nr:cardiolipin synthase [Salinispira pacifica]AHC15327.1 Cardiolipin synthetase [Salinispira pacifica]